MTDKKILLAVCLVLFFFGGWWLPITDPTECCYTLTAKEMLAAGDYFSPRIYGDFWYDKPIFFYWELILAYKIFGVNEFASRFFPAVFATLGIFLTYSFAEKLYNKKIAFTAAIILATSVEYWYIAHAVITDMTLFCAVSTTLMTFYFGYVEKKPKLYLISYAAAGIAVLTKGPIGFLLPGLIILIFLAVQKDLKYLPKLLRGVPITILVAAVWYLPMYFLHGRIFLDNFLGVHNFLRATQSEHPEVDVWFYYLIVFVVGLAAWVLPIIAEFLKERRLPKFDTRQKFLLIWAAAVFVVFQSFATKYVTYTFPYMMPLAILFAGFFVKREKLFRNMAAGMIIFLTVSTLVAIPIVKENSGKAAAEIISPLVDEKTCVVSYRRVYSGSLVFYSGAKIFRLEDTATISKLKPDRMSWTTLNVMPFLDFKNLPRDKKIVAIVDKEREEKFFELAGKNWRLVENFDEYKIVVRD